MRTKDNQWMCGKSKSSWQEVSMIVLQFHKAPYSDDPGCELISSLSSYEQASAAAS